MPAFSVVGQEPVGQHVGRVAAAVRGQVGQGRADPALVLRPGDGHQADPVGVLVRDHRAGDPVPFLPGLRPPLRVAEHPLLLRPRRLDHLVPAVLQGEPGHAPVPVHVDIQGARADLRVVPHALRLQLPGEVEHVPGPVRVILIMEDADPGAHHPARAGQAGHPLHVPAHLAAGGGRDELDELAVPGQHVQQRAQLGVIGLAAGHRALVAVLVEAEGRGHGRRAGRQRLVQHRGDACPLVAGGGAVPGGLAHHVAAEHVVPDHPGHVHPEAAERFHRRQVLAITLPAPRDGHVEHVGRQVLDVAQQFLEAAPVPGADRGQRQRAVADQDRGHPVLRHRVTQRVPEDRGVEVSMDVDEPGRDIGTRRIQHPLTLWTQARPDLGDPSAADPDVGRAGGRAGAVDQRAPADQEIGHVSLPGSVTKPGNS